MNPSLLALYGLKWNPFSQELPTEALRLTRQPISSGASSTTTCARAASR